MSSPLLILNYVEMPYKWNLFQRDHLDVNKDRSGQHMRKQKATAAGAKTCWCSSCFHTTAHLPLVQQKSQRLPWQEKAVSVNNQGSQASNNCDQLHYPKLLCLLLHSPLPVSLFIKTRLCGMLYYQKEVSWRKIFPATFLMKNLMKCKVSSPVPKENKLEKLIVLF